MLLGGKKQEITSVRRATLRSHEGRAGQRLLPCARWRVETAEADGPRAGGACQGGAALPRSASVLSSSLTVASERETFLLLLMFLLCSR